jgi:AcrR family transcriptional regulator
MARGNLKKIDYVMAAIEFADESGLDAMTMRSLGTKMGVDPTAVYRHFPTKEDLVNAMVDVFLQGVLARVDQTETNPRQHLINTGLATRSEFKKHPDVGVALVHSTGASEAGYKLSTDSATALVELGVANDRIAIAYQMFEGFTIGSCCQDYIGSPQNFEIRRGRYRAMDNPVFDMVATSDESVEEVANAAYIYGLNFLIDGAIREFEK